MKQSGTLPVTGHKKKRYCQSEPEYIQNKQTLTVSNF